MTTATDDKIRAIYIADDNIIEADSDERELILGNLYDKGFAAGQKEGFEDGISRLMTLLSNSIEVSLRGNNRTINCDWDELKEEVRAIKEQVGK